MDQPTPEQAAEIASLQHRMQSGVAFLQSHRANSGQRDQATEPKHLRVGVNAAMVDNSAIVRLLVAKGIFSADEYYETLIEAWREEVARYQAEIAEVDPRLKI